MIKFTNKSDTNNRKERKEKKKKEKNEVSGYTQLNLAFYTMLLLHCGKDQLETIDTIDHNINVVLSKQVIA